MGLKVSEDFVAMSKTDVGRTFRLVYSISRSAFAFLDHRTEGTGAFNATINSPGAAIPTVVLIGDRKETWEGIPVHVGLSAQVDLPADDIHAAVAHAGAVLDGLLSMLSIQANPPAHEPVLEHGHETTAGAKSVEYIQMHRFEGEIFKRKRTLDMEAVGRVIDRSLKIQDDARVGRAFRWYRKGLMEQDSIDRFSAFRMALENLNPVFARLLGETPEIRQCTNCQSPYEVETLKGVRTLFAHHSPNGLTDFRDCRDARVGIMHGTKRLSAVSSVIDLRLETCRSVLRKGLGLILGLTESEFGGDPQPYYTLKDSWVELSGVVETTPDVLGVSPPLDLSAMTIGVDDSGENRTLQIKGTIKSVVSAKFTVNGKLAVPATSKVTSTLAPGKSDL